MPDFAPHDLPKPQPESTRVESVDEVRQALRARRASAVPEAEPAVAAYRPLRRPPMALLCILDDGLDDGEWVRLRTDRVVIGRADADIVIPHDGMMSSQHAELCRRPEHGGFRWHLNDLHSTNGTYVRIGKTVLRHQQELLLGARRYRFEDACRAAVLADESSADSEKPRGTQGWEVAVPVPRLPGLVELTPDGEGRRWPLTQAENWIGRDPAQCAVAIPDDPLVSPRHGVIHRDAKGRWLLENAKSHNGLWLRTDSVAIDGTCQFQLGEQRFLVRVL